MRERITAEKRDRIEELVLSNEKTYREIASIVGVSTTTVNRYARLIGVNRKRSNNSRLVRCIETGEVFPSGYEAQLMVRPESVSGSSVLMACKTGRPYRGYHWEYADE